MTVRLLASYSRRGLELCLLRGEAPVPGSGVTDLRGLTVEPGAGLPSFTGTSRSERLWLLERSKATADQALLFQLCESIAVACRTMEGRREVFLLPDTDFNLRTLDRTLLAAGLAVCGSRWRRIRERAGFVLAAVVAFCLHWLLLLRYCTEKPQHLPPHGPLLAVHGEWSSRTRHVLGAPRLRAGAGAVLVLGRPRQSLRRIADLWRCATGDKPPPLVRPISPGAAVRSLGPALRGLKVGMQSLDAPGGTHGFSLMSRQCYRYWLGAASAAWWSERAGPGRDVIYGHTGLADTSQLEYAQQDGGGRTVHVVHGLSSGINFAGISSLALFRCGADARFYRRLQVYDRCEWLAARAPESRHRGRGVALYTNYLHPMRSGDPAAGLRLELASLGLVREFAQRDGVSDLYWRHHPAAGSMPGEATARLKQVAADMGWEPLLPPPRGRAESDYYFVVTSPSTIVVDLLALGALPVMLDLDLPVEQTALLQYPLRAKDAAGLSDWCRRLEDDVERERWYRLCWDSIGPAIAADSIRRILPGPGQ